MHACEDVCMHACMQNLTSRRSARQPRRRPRREDRGAPGDPIRPIRAPYDSSDPISPHPTPIRPLPPHPTPTHPIPSDPSDPPDPSDPSDPSGPATLLHFGEERRTWRQFHTSSTWPRWPEVATVAQFDAPETSARAVWKRAPRTATEHILSNSEPEVAKGLRLR